jgi:hypothetical protein
MVVPFVFLAGASWSYEVADRVATWRYSLSVAEDAHNPLVGNPHECIRTMTREYFGISFAVVVITLPLYLLFLRLFG